MLIFRPNELKVLSQLHFVVLFKKTNYFPEKQGRHFGGRGGGFYGPPQGFIILIFPCKSYI